MLTLYGVYRSRATRPLWMLAEAGLKFTHVPVIQSYRLATPGAADAPLNTASAAFTAINPMGQIPVLQDGDLVLTESMAITLHIAQSHARAFAPQTDAERAMATNWALFAATSVEAVALEIYYIMMDGRAATPEGEALLAIASEKLRRPMAHLNAALTGRDWLLGTRFTAVDINVAECVRYASGQAALMAEFPAVQAWLTRCHARPGFQTMWQNRLAEPA